jgi:putative ABC transport system permease protein
MRVYDLLRTVRHTFATNRGRVILTLLGVVIGAGSIVLLASLLDGGQEALVKTNQGASDADLVRVDPDDPSWKDLNKTRRELGRGDAQLLDGSPLLAGAQITTENGKWTTAYLGKEHKRVSLVATAPVARTIYKLELERGRFLVDDDLRAGSRVAVVGVNVWRDLLGAPEKLDRVTVQVDGIEWPVVGVLRNKPAFGNGGGGDNPWMWNNKILVPQTTYDAIFEKEHKVKRVFVRIADGGAATLEGRLFAGRAAIGSAILRHHFGVHNFKIDRWGKEKAQEDLIIGIIKTLLLGTGLLSLFVGGINIMNIMLVTVTERTREIGIRRAIGADPRSILLQFVLEAALIALAGGLIGVGGGIMLGWTIATLLAHALGSWSFHVAPWSVALGLGLSLGTGIVFGLFPAWRAGKLDPVTALRSE